MAVNPPLQAPIIIRRRKIYKAAAHHGGAWKVAYADFVTAMMAFFLLMWLLNATTEEQRKGIADYFNSSIPISRISGGGNDGLNGSSVFTEMTLAQSGTGSKQIRNDQPDPSVPQNPLTDSQRAANAQISEGLDALKSSLANGERKLSEHLLIKMSPDGIVLEITDAERAPLFVSGRSEPSETFLQLIGEIAEVFGQFDNSIKIVGHTDSMQYRNNAIYDNWNLSADRANATRRLLMRAGLAPDRVQEVAGKAASEPLIPDNPSAPQNRRISITILTR